MSMIWTVAVGLVATAASWSLSGHHRAVHIVLTEHRACSVLSGTWDGSSRAQTAGRGGTPSRGGRGAPRGGGRGGRGGSGRGGRTGRAPSNYQNSASQRDIAYTEVPMPSRQPRALPADASLRLAPSGIQTLNSLQTTANDAALRGLDVFIHAETGSGKTLCFVLPTLALFDPSEPSPTSGTSALRVLVLSPTLELASQTAHVYNTLRPGCAAAVHRETSALPRTAVVVGPPGILWRLMTDASTDPKGGRLRRVDVAALAAVVLDEADALLQTMGRYATAREKASREAHPKEAALLLGALSDERGHAMQVRTASAAVAVAVVSVAAVTGSSNQPHVSAVARPPATGSRCLSDGGPPSPQGVSAPLRPQTRACP